MYHDVYDCTCITESWLHSSICDGVIDPRREYLIVRKDRLGNKGGGVCILVKHSISVVPLDLDTRYSALEIAGVEFIALQAKLQFLLFTAHLIMMLRVQLTCNYLLTVCLFTPLRNVLML